MDPLELSSIVSFRISLVLTGQFICPAETPSSHSVPVQQFSLLLFRGFPPNCPKFFSDLVFFKFAIRKEKHSTHPSIKWIAKERKLIFNIKWLVTTFVYSQQFKCHKAFCIFFWQLHHYGTGYLMDKMVLKAITRWLQDGLNDSYENLVQYFFFWSGGGE